PQTLGPPGQFGLTPRWGPSRRVPGQLGFASRPTWPRAPLGPLVAGTPGAGLSSLLVPVLAQQLLVELAHRGARHLVDDIDFVGHLPLGEALTEGGDDVLPGHLGAARAERIGHRALFARLVGSADAGCFLDARVVEDRVLHVDRPDPLATGLDDVLEPVGDLEIAVLVDDTDVTGSPPSVEEALGVVRQLVVGLADPRTAPDDLAPALSAA